MAEAYRRSPRVASSDTGGGTLPPVLSAAHDLSRADKRSRIPAHMLPADATHTGSFAGRVNSFGESPILASEAEDVDAETRRLRLPSSTSAARATTSGVAASRGGSTPGSSPSGWEVPGVARVTLPSRRVRRRPKVIKTVLAAVALFTIGSIMLWAGIRELSHGDRERAIAMIVIGSIAFIPGVYASSIIAGALLHWQGYDIRDLPSYDDDDSADWYNEDSDDE